MVNKRDNDALHWLQSLRCVRPRQEVSNDSAGELVGPPKVVLWCKPASPPPSLRVPDAQQQPLRLGALAALLVPWCPAGCHEATTLDPTRMHAPLLCGHPCMEF